MDNQSNQHQYLLRFLTHLLAQAAGWVVLIYIRVPLSSLPLLFPVSHAANLELSYFLLPFWTLGIWITQIHRQSVPLPRIILTFVITTLLSLLTFFAIRDFGALSRSIFISEVIISPLIAILVARMWPFTAHQNIKIELDLEGRLGGSKPRAYHVGMRLRQMTLSDYSSKPKSRFCFLDIPNGRPNLPAYRNPFKSSIDILGATVGLLILSPIMLVTAALIYLLLPVSGGSQWSMFPLYKFGRWSPSDSLKDKLMDEQLEGPAFKMKRPSHYSIGAIIPAQHRQVRSCSMCFEDTCHWWVQDHTSQKRFNIIPLSNTVDFL